MWAQRRRKGDRRSWEYIENWPILEKQSLRKRAPAFVADDCRRSKMFHDHTSGTTGTSIDIWLSADTVKDWYALHEARSRRWYGVSRKDRWAMFGGQLVTRQAQREPPFWVWNAGLNQLYMSAYHIAPQFTRAYLRALARYRIRYLLGYPSAIYNLAYEAIRQKLPRVTFDVVVANAEPLYQYQREVISEAFSCPVRETYGMAEIAAAASECTQTRLHQWPEAGIIEIDPENTDDDGTGDLICTGLMNQDMPLIRYRVGDVGGLSNDECDCGKRLPLLAHIEGRRDDILFTRDGRRVGRLDPIFKKGLPVVEAQIIQRSLSSVVVRYVPDDGFDGKSRLELADRLRERMGDIEVGFDEVGAIPRTSRGKFKAVVCEIPADTINDFNTKSSITLPRA
jgi:phenylacetate-CoA ligase